MNLDASAFEAVVTEAAGMADAATPLDTPRLAPEQRLPGALDAIRTVLVADDTVLTASVHRFGSSDEARASVEHFARVLFSYDDARHLLRLDLTSITSDAQGAVASGLDEGPGSLVMSAWSREVDRFDLSVSVLREDLEADRFWDAFSRETYDRVAAAMMRVIP